MVHHVGESETIPLLPLLVCVEMTACTCGLMSPASTAHCRSWPSHSGMWCCAATSRTCAQLALPFYQQHRSQTAVP